MFARVKHGLYKQRRVIVLRVNGVIALFLHSALKSFTFYSLQLQLVQLCRIRLAAFARLSFFSLLLLQFCK